MSTVVLEPAAHAMVWLGLGRPQERLAVPTVALADGDVLVEIELATICGSDVHTVRGDRTSPAPSILGHEHVGRITALGAGAVLADGRPAQVGDRVVWSVAVSCGECRRCAAGMPQKCLSLRKGGHERITSGWELNGAFATHAHLPRGSAIVQVAEGIPAAVLAPSSCGTATAWAAAEAALDGRSGAGLEVLITGGGLVGLAACAIMADRGARVTLSDPSPTRREQARSFGAAVVLDPRTDAMPVTDAVIEASGAPAAVVSGIAALDIGGVLALVGSVFPAPPVELRAEDLVRGLGTIRGVHNYTPQHLVDALAWVTEAHERYPFAGLVSTSVTLDDLDAGIALATQGEHVRVGVRPRETGSAL